jgi:hypothetical protein
MDGSIIEETQAFIGRQREALVAQREQIFSRQQALQSGLDSVNAMLAKFDVFEGKAKAGLYLCIHRFCACGFPRGEHADWILRRRRVVSPSFSTSRNRLSR